VAIGLSLFGHGLLISKQVETMKGFWYDKVEVTVYLCGEASSEETCGGAAVTDEQRRQIGADLEDMPQVEQVFYESKEEAYERFREQFSDSPDLVANVTADALPESYRVKLRDPTQFDVIASAFQDEPGVEQVQDLRAVLEDFFNIMNEFRRMALIAAGAGLVAAALLISNTIRVAAFSRRRETGIMRLVGASNFSIQLPFLLEGILAGIAGAALASGSLFLTKWIVIDRRLKPRLQFTDFVNYGDVWGIVPVLFATAIVLAGLSSFITLRRFLRV